MWRRPIPLKLIEKVTVCPLCGETVTIENFGDRKRFYGDERDDTWETENSNLA